MSDDLTPPMRAAAKNTSDGDELVWVARGAPPKPRLRPDGTWVARYDWIDLESVGDTEDDAAQRLVDGFADWLSSGPDARRQLEKHLEAGGSADVHGWLVPRSAKRELLGRVMNAALSMPLDNDDGALSMPRDDTAVF